MVSHLEQNCLNKEKQLHKENGSHVALCTLFYTICAFWFHFLYLQGNNTQRNAHVIPCCNKVQRFLEIAICKWKWNKNPNQPQSTDKPSPKLFNDSAFSSYQPEGSVHQIHLTKRTWLTTPLKYRWICRQINGVSYQSCASITWTIP